MRASVFNGFCVNINLYFLVCILSYPKESKPLYCSEDRCPQQAESIIKAAVLLPCRDGLLPLLLVGFFSSCYFLDYLIENLNDREEGN